jgi:hypothetical protein
MAYADLHVHSNFSPDGTARIETILETVKTQTNLAMLAITDHDEIEGALLAEVLAPSYGLTVITGSEVSTSEGHLLALFIRERIPSGLSLLDTLHYVDAQGGLCIAPHPGARFTDSLSLKAIENVLNEPIGQKVLVGIEVFNAGIFRLKSNGLAMNFALHHDIAISANSDAHVTGMIGRAATGFTGNTITDLRNALKNRTTSMFRSYSIKSSYIIYSWLHNKLIVREARNSPIPSTSPA